MSEPRFEKFKVGELFDRIESVKGKVTRDLVAGNDINYIAAKKSNNGVQMRCCLAGIESLVSEGNCIVFVCLGDGSAGYSTYQPDDFVGMAGKIQCGYIDGVMDERVGMYLVACLDKHKQLFSHARSWTGERLRSTVIVLPIQLDANNNPVIDSEHTYHSKGFVPDWDYMRECIRELEQARIRELVMYLKVTGLDDCVLTDEDQAVLAAWREQTPPLSKFKMSELFEFKGLKQAKCQKDIPEDANGVLYVVQSQSNNMVSRMVNEDWLIANGEEPVDGNAIVLGVTLPCVSYQPVKFGGSQLILARAELLDELVGEFMVACIEKHMYQFTYSKKPGIARYKELELSLPVIAGTREPDFDFMRRYIKAQQKLVVANVARAYQVELDTYEDMIAQSDAGFWQ